MNNKKSPSSKAINDGRIKMDMKKCKKGSINLMVPFAISFVVVVIVIALGGSLLGTFQAGQTANSLPYNITSKGLDGVKTFGDYLPTIAIVLVIAVIIAIIVTYLYSKFARG